MVSLSVNISVNKNVIKVCEAVRESERETLAGAGGAVEGRDRDRAGDQEERELLESLGLAPGPPAGVLISGTYG